MDRSKRALVSLATVIRGVASALLRRERWPRTHYYCMAWSYIGLLAAACAEAMVRAPALHSCGQQPFEQLHWESGCGTVRGCWVHSHWLVLKLGCCPLQNERPCIHAGLTTRWQESDADGRSKRASPWKKRVDAANTAGLRHAHRSCHLRQRRNCARGRGDFWSPHVGAPQGPATKIAVDPASRAGMISLSRRSRT